MDLKWNLIIGIITGTGGFTLRTIFNILLIPLMIQFLGTEDFSFFIFLVGLNELFLLLDLGITSGLIHRLSYFLSQQDTAGISRQLYIGQWLFGSMACLMAISGYFISPVLPGLLHLSEQHQSIAPLAFQLVFIDGAVSLGGAYCHAILKAHCLHQWTNINETLQAILNNVFSVVLLLLGFGLVPILVLRLLINLANILTLVYRVIQVQPGSFQWRGDFSWTSLKDLFSYSVYSMIQRVSVYVAYKLDDVVLATFLTMSAVGIYGLVVRVFSYVSMFCSKVTEALFPVFSHTAATADHDQQRVFFIRFSALVCYLANILILVIMMNFPELIRFLGSGKISIQQTLPIALLMVPVVWSGILQTPASNYLATNGRQRFLTYSLVLASLLNLGLSVVLVQHVGILGPAIGTLIPHFIVHQFVHITLTCRMLGLPYSYYLVQVHGKNLLPLLLAFGCMAFGRFLANWEHPHPGIMTLFTGLALLLSAIAWVFHTASPEERHFIKTRFSRRFFPNPQVKLTLVTDDTLVSVAENGHDPGMTVPSPKG